MATNRNIFGILALLTLFLVGFGVPKKLEKKVSKEVVKTFKIDDFTVEPVSLSGQLSTELPSKITQDNFFKVHHTGNLIGYLFIDSAPSKTARFDYLVILDDELKIVHSKVLIYREEYGGEIGSTRWLKQFLGKSGTDRVNHETNIDGIAGATISVRSMTNAMDNLLQTIGILQEKNML